MEIGERTHKFHQRAAARFRNCVGAGVSPAVQPTRSISAYTVSWASAGSDPDAGCTESPTDRPAGVAHEDIPI